MGLDFLGTVCRRAFCLFPVPASAQDTALKQDTALQKDATYSKEELDQILAPIALYPDDLLSNVLVAATYPLEVLCRLARWIEEPAHARLNGNALTQALEAQDWDPSVKSLTQFPYVLAMMNEQLDWTQKLGDAFLASETDVMDRIQFREEQGRRSGPSQKQRAPDRDDETFGRNWAHFSHRAGRTGRSSTCRSTSQPSMETGGILTIRPTTGRRMARTRMTGTGVPG